MSERQSEHISHAATEHESEPRSDFRTDLGLLSLAVIWGLNFPVLKTTLLELDPLALNALRFPIAATIVLLFLRQSGPIPLPDPEDRLRLIWLGFLGNVVYQLLFIVGVNLTLAGNASILLATTPVWTLLLSMRAGHERATWALSVGVIGTLIGMVLVVTGGGGEVALQGHSVGGDLLMVASAIAWSFYTVGSRDLIQKYGSLPTTAWTLGAGTVFVFLIGIPSLLRTDFGSVSASSWLGVLYAGALAIGLAYVLWYRGVQKIGNSRTAVFSNLVPVVALVAAWIWLGETPALLQIAGAAVIIAGLTLTRFAKSPAAPKRLRWRVG